MYSPAQTELCRAGSCFNWFISILLADISAESLNIVDSNLFWFIYCDKILLLNRYFIKIWIMSPIRGKNTRVVNQIKHLMELITQNAGCLIKLMHIFWEKSLNENYLKAERQFTQK